VENARAIKTISISFLFAARCLIVGLSGRSRFAVALYELLNPIPLGFFTAAWIFDILYIKSMQIMWTDAASWLIVIGLVIAIIPREYAESYFLC